MIACDSSEFSYVPGPSCPDWHGHPDQSLLDLFETNRAAVRKDDRPWYARMKSHGSKARKRKIGLDTLAAGYDSLIDLVDYTMFCRNSLTTIDDDLEHMHELVGCIERQRELIKTCADTLSEQQISEFNDCRASAFRAEVLYLMTAEQRQRGTNVCLDKAEEFCTSGVHDAFYWIKGRFAQMRADILANPNCRSMSNTNTAPDAIEEDLDPPPEYRSVAGSDDSDGDWRSAETHL